MSVAIMDVKTPSFFLLSASPASGKTSMIKYLIYILSKANRFSAGFVFTNTGFNGDFSFLPQKAVSAYNEEKLKSIMRYQREGVNDGTAKNIFIVLDDVLGSINWSSNLWTGIISTYRHYKITLFVSTQYIYRVPPLIRACASYAFVFAPKEGRTVKALHETFGNGMCAKEFEAMLRENTLDYNCLMIDNFDPRGQTRTKIKAELVDYKLEY